MTKVPGFTAELASTCSTMRPRLLYCCSITVNSWQLVNRRPHKHGYPVDVYMPGNEVEHQHNEEIATEVGPGGAGMWRMGTPAPPDTRMQVRGSGGAIPKPARLRSSPQPHWPGMWIGLPKHQPPHKPGGHQRAAKSPRGRYEGPWVWLAYRALSLFDSHSRPLFHNLCTSSALSKF